MCPAPPSATPSVHLKARDDHAEVVSSCAIPTRVVQDVHIPEVSSSLVLEPLLVPRLALALAIDSMPPPWAARVAKRGKRARERSDRAMPRVATVALAGVPAVLFLPAGSPRAGRVAPCPGPLVEPQQGEQGCMQPARPGDGAR